MATMDVIESIEYWCSWRNDFLEHTYWNISMDIMCKDRLVAAMRLSIPRLTHSFGLPIYFRSLEEMGLEWVMWNKVMKARLARNMRHMAYRGQHISPRFQIEHGRRAE